MKIYLVDVDNGESYEDYRHSIIKVFTTYRAASDWLIKENYEPFPTRKFYNDILDVEFYWEESDKNMVDCSFAKIIEMKLED